MHISLHSQPNTQGDLKASFGTLSEQFPPLALYPANSSGFGLFGSWFSETVILLSFSSSFCQGPKKILPGRKLGQLQDFPLSWIRPRLPTDQYLKMVAQYSFLAINGRRVGLVPVTPWWISLCFKIVSCNLVFKIQSKKLYFLIRQLLLLIK